MEDQKLNQSKKRNGLRLSIFVLNLFIFFIPIVLLALKLVLKSTFESILPIALIVMIVLIGSLFLQLRRFFNGIEIIHDSAYTLSRGNLNISDIFVDKTKGLEVLAVALNDLKTDLLNFIESTKINVIVLSDSIDNVTRSIDMSYKGNEQIATNMTAVAEKAQEQLKIVQNTIEKIEEVSDGIGSITTHLANIDEFVGTTVTKANEGLEYLDKYNEHMKIISHNLTDTANFIVMLNSRLQEIDKVNGLIINITEQLQLLSLNSSIEAARAGSAGKGFVVVAQEMSKLSVATEENVSQINKLITDILESNSKVSESIDECVDNYSKSDEVFGSVKESFYTISKNANILSTDMRKVYDESRLINDNTKEISERGQVLLDASNDISSITQDVAAVTEEELAGNTEISNQAASLQNMLYEISNLLSKYKTSVEPVKESSSKRLRIAMISPLDNPFWQSVRQGALFAKNELKTKNADIEYIGLEQMNNEVFIKLFDEKVEAGYDGIVIPGFVTGIEPYIEKANSRNIQIITFNCDLPAGVKRLAYFGPDVMASGTMAGELLLKCIEGSGDVAIFRGGFAVTINKIRRDTVVTALHKKKNVRIVAELEAIHDAEVYQGVKDTLHDYPNITGIVIIGGHVRGAAKAIEELGRVGKTKIVCFDTDQEVMELINKGIIYAAMGQDPFGQGHDPIISLYNYLITKTKLNDINYTRNQVVDIRNASK